MASAQTPFWPGPAEPSPELPPGLVLSSEQEGPPVPARGHAESSGELLFYRLSALRHCWKFVSQSRGHFLAARCLRALGSDLTTRVLAGMSHGHTHDTCQLRIPG